MESWIVSHVLLPWILTACSQRKIVLRLWTSSPVSWCYWMPIVSGEHDETRSCVCILSAEPDPIRTIPGVVNLQATEWVLQFVRGTYILDLTYFDQNRCKSLVSVETKNNLIGWVDSDFGSDPEIRKSMTGYLMSLNGDTIS